MALSLQRYTWSDSSSTLNRILQQRIRKERESSMIITIVTRDVLPENLIFEILSWLSVKALLQFKTVCKSWYALITSPDFVSKHLKNYYRNNNDSDCLLAQYYVSHAELQLFELLVDEKTPRILEDEVLYNMPIYGSYVCGPCDGIYYLYLYYTSDRALWNPAINELRMLPPIPTNPNLPSNLIYAQHDVYGFGYDPLTRDYKVVVIKGYWSTTDDEVTHSLSVFMYSLGSDSWRYCGDLDRNYDLDNSKCYTLVNGCFYWMGLCSHNENSEVIVCFDLATDAFHDIHVPDYEQPASKRLGVYHDSLAFFTIHEIKKHFDIWTWSDGLWTKKFTMGSCPGLENPVGHWKNNEVLLESKGCKLFVCDTNTEEIRDLGFQRFTRCHGVFAYKESLVSIKDRNSCGPVLHGDVDEYPNKDEDEYPNKDEDEYPVVDGDGDEDGKGETIIPWTLFD